MRFGFKNTVARIKKFGKNAYEKLQVLGQKVNENKKLISMLGGLLVATGGIGATANYYDKQGKTIQSKIDKIKNDKKEAKEIYDMFPKVPTYIPQRPKQEIPSTLPTDFWN